MAADITSDEVKAALLAVGITGLTPSEYEAFAVLMTQNAAVVAEIAEAAIYEEMRAAITADVSGAALDAALASAENAARIAAETLATNLNTAELKSIGSQIAKGLDAGKGPEAISRTLDAVRGLDNARAATYEKMRAFWEGTISDEELERRMARLHGRLLRSRKKTIAGTEARFATSEARQIAAKERGARHKTWITVGDDRVSDACESNEAAGVIPINGTFPGGVTQPPQHPNCRCTLAYATSDAQAGRMQDRSEVRAANTAAAKAEPEEAAIVAA